MKNHQAAGVLIAVVLGSSAFQTKPIQVTIDVKPGDTPTVVERARGGFLPVAILTTGEFDALAVDPSTVRVGPTGTEAEAARTVTEDVNGDGRRDLMLLVRAQDLNITCEVKAIRLTGATMAGAAIEGSETVVVDGCGHGEARRGR